MCLVSKKVLASLLTGGCVGCWKARVTSLWSDSQLCRLDSPAALLSPLVLCSAGFKLRFFLAFTGIIESI